MHLLQNEKKNIVDVHSFSLKLTFALGIFDFISSVKYVYLVNCFFS
jgi:hypothetical protein